MNYYYSAENNAFYPDELKPEYESSGTWPMDAILVSEFVFIEYSQSLVDKVRTSSADGFPCWGDVPPLTIGEFIAHAEAEKQRLLVLANTVIAPLADAVDLEIATTDEINLYTTWRKYRVLLNRVDTSTAPNIAWPIQPL